MGNNPSNHQPLERAHVSKYGDVNSAASKGNGRRSLRSPRKMDRLRRSFRDSFRKRKDRMPESSKPHQWQADEQAVRSGTCTFVVKYLGCVEVFESRGMQVCEEALKVLRASRRRPIRAVLHVSGDGLRVVEDETKGLIVDQTIEKVSFCAPDRNYERGFSYICRDGTTRRWMCHGFLAYRDSGERLSHAVGCAFAACLERKQRRDKECGVTMTFDQTTNTFTRTGSFRTQSITERIENEDAPKTNAAVNPFAIERPHATPHMLERQGSFRGLSQLGNNSPFKRQMSLRISELPSNAERLKAYRGPNGVNGNGKAVSPIPELSPGDSVTALCQQLSQGLSQLTHSGSDDFNFNSEASINQNNIGLSSGFGPNMTPNRPGFVAPINLSFNSNLDHSPISNSALGQHNSYSPISSTLGQSQSSLGQSQNSLGQSQTSLGQSQNSLGQISRMRASPSLSQTSSLVHRGPSPNPSLNQLSRMGQSIDHSPGSGLGHRGPSPIGSRLARMGQSIDHGVGQLGHQRVLSANESIRGVRTFGPGNTSPNFGDVDHQGVSAPVQNSLNMGAGVTSIGMGGNVTRLGPLTNSTGDNLPKPEQWLGHIVQSTTPARDAESGVSPGRRGPNVGAHSRTMSLGSAESFGRLPQVDPFDAEWAAIATRTNGDHGGVSTNPFLNPGAPQAFQIQL